MKINACLGLILIAALAGCSQHYDVLLNNGATIAAFSKPKPDGHGNYVFKNKAGEKVAVREMRVIEIKVK